jgi:hypothetical protein
VVTGHLLILISIGVAVGILILIGVLFVIGLSADDPSPNTLAELGVAGESAVKTISDLREQRFESIKELMRLLVIALAVPMMAIVLSYFSERTPKSERIRRLPPPKLPEPEPDLSSEAEDADRVPADRHGG